MNILAVKNLMQTTTIPVAWDYLINFGFSTLKDSDKVPSMALGGLTTGVTQKEVTAAMGAIANNGIYNKPILYTKIVDHDNKTTILENADSSRRVLKSASAYVLTDMMKSVMVSPGTGVTAKFRNVNMPIAGKTGTTTDDKDLTFVGYTPYYVSGIWLGFDTPKQMKKSTSSSHLVLWRTVMERIHENLPYKDFEEPDDITHATICTVSGELAIPGICDELNIARTEVFISGTEPKESCSYHMHNTPEPNLNNEDNSALNPDPKDIDDDNSPISTNPPPSTAKPTPTQDYINPEPSSDQINNDSNGVEVYIPTQVSNKQDSFAYY
jgi:penicillin-binding protein 1A